MTEKQRTPGAAFFVAVVLAAAVLLYPVTFGIAVWLSARDFFERTTVQTAYRPLLWLVVRSPEPVWVAIHWWGEIGIPSDRGVKLSVPTPEDDDVGVWFGRLPFGVGTSGSGMIFLTGSAGASE
jgi:hypothetical protein